MQNTFFTKLKKYCNFVVVYIYILNITIYADVVKLVDTPALGAGVARHGGSSPLIRTSPYSTQRNYGWHSQTYVRTYEHIKVPSNEVQLGAKN